MKIVNTVLFGLGTVNIGFLKILLEKNKEILEKYHLQFKIIAIADSSGVAMNNEGFDYGFLVDLKKGKNKVSTLPDYCAHILHENIPDFLAADLLIESSPGNLLNGNPGLAVARKALEKGWSVVFANKAPLIFAFDELHRLADIDAKRMAYSSTVCGGLPVINVLQRDLKVTSLKRLQGIFNATTNYILQEVENGGTMEEAIREAQRLGAAEADPSHDTHGHDTANKLFIIMKSFTDFKGTVQDISIEGIQQILPQHLADARSRGYKIKLLASAERNGDAWKLSVKPTEVALGSFLSACDGWEMGIDIQTDLYESIAMKNYEADPVGTSAAVLRDAIELSLRKY